VQAESIKWTVKSTRAPGRQGNSLKGNIDLHTNGRSITVDSLKGDIRLHTGDGSMKPATWMAKSMPTPAMAIFRIAGRFDALNVKTGDGSVDTRVQPGSKMASSWTIRTGDGSVDLVLRSDFQTNIDASTGDGHISLGIPVTVGRHLQQLTDSRQDERWRPATDDPHRRWLDPAKQDLAHRPNGRTKRASLRA